MRLKDVNTLAKSKVKRYKRRTLLMIAPMGLFFGVIMALLLVFVSLKATAFREMDKVSSDIYIDIYDDDDNIVTMKLDATLEMTNNKIFYINDDDARNTEIEKTKAENKNLPKFVRKNFKYDEEKDLYTYSKIIDDNNVKFEYSDNQKTLSIYDNGIKYLYEYKSSQLVVYLNYGSELKKLLIYDFKQNMVVYKNSEESKKYLDKFNEKYKKML